MRALFRLLRKYRYQYQPLVEIHISKQRLIDNLRSLKTLAPKGGVAPVLKSNAYGHGLIIVAKILDREKPPFFVVDSYFEAMTLRNEKIRSPILIIGFTRTENIVRNKLKDTAFTLTAFDQLKELSARLSRPKYFHLKIDTGMNRQGIRLENLVESISLIKKNKNIKLEGVCSHLASATDQGDPLNQKQIESWRKAMAIVKKEFPDLRYCHLGATASHQFTKEIDANVSRSGIGLYGIDPSGRLKMTEPIKPVLSMESIVSGLKEVKVGENIGYDKLFTATRNMKIATVPVGYYEGVNKNLTNRGGLSIDGVNCPIVGRVNMNITTIDVSSIPTLSLGDKVTVISDSPRDINSAESMARLANSSPYEILVHIPARIRRVVF